MNEYSAFSIAIFKCTLQVSYLWVICRWDRTSAYAGAAGSCYQSISDLTQYMNEMRPDYNTGNSIPYMRYSLAHECRLQETRWAEWAAYSSSTVLAVMANVIQQRKNGHCVLSTRTMLGVTTAGPALLAQASSTANKVLRSGVLILPMHKGVRERVTAKRRPSGLRKWGLRKWVTRHFGGQFAFVKHCLEGGTLSFCVLHLNF